MGSVRVVRLLVRTSPDVAVGVRRGHLWARQLARALMAAAEEARSVG